MKARFRVKRCPFLWNSYRASVHLNALDLHDHSSAWSKYEPHWLCLPSVPRMRTEYLSQRIDPSKALLLRSPEEANSVRAGIRTSDLSIYEVS